MMTEKKKVSASELAEKWGCSLEGLKGMTELIPAFRRAKDKFVSIRNSEILDLFPEGLYFNADEFNLAAHVRGLICDDTYDEGPYVAAIELRRYGLNLEAIPDHATVYRINRKLGFHQVHIPQTLPKPNDFESWWLVFIPRQEFEELKG